MQPMQPMPIEDLSKTRQWGRQLASAADDLIEQIAADTVGRIERDITGRPTVVRDSIKK